MSITHGFDKTTLQFIFDNPLRTELFAKWQTEIQKIFEVNQFAENLDQSKIFNFYQAFLDSLEGRESYRHFQILDTLIPEFLLRNFSEQNFLLALSKLRNIIIHSITRSSSGAKDGLPTVISSLLDSFDELNSFIKGNYLLHDQLNEEKINFSFEQLTCDMPVGLFHVFGPRFGSKTIVNKYLAHFCGVNQNDSFQHEFWADLIEKNELIKIRNLLKLIYKEKKRKYTFRYSLKFRNKKYYPVVEEAHIEYDLKGDPIAVSGYLIPESNYRFDQPKHLINITYLTDILEVISAAVFICDFTGTVISCNSELIEKFGFKRELFEKSPLLKWMTPEFKTKVKTFDEFINRYTKQNKFIIKMTNSKDEIIQVEVTYRNLDLIGEEPFYLFSLKKIENNVRNISTESQFYQRLKFLTEIQKELILIKNPDQLLEDVLVYALELIPVAEAGSLLTFKKGVWHYHSVKGYDLKKLQSISWLPEKIESNMHRNHQLQRLFKRDSTCELVNLTQFARYLVAPDDYESLRRTGQLDEIKSTLLGIIKVDTIPFAILYLDNYEVQKNFSEDDKNIFQLFLEYISLFLQNTITDQKKQNEPLTYDTLFENSPLATFIEHNNEIKYVNPQFLKLTGYKIEDLTGRSIWELVDPRHSEGMKKHINQYLSSNVRFADHELKMLQKDGNEVYCIGYFSKIHVEKSTALLGEISVITEKKILETRLTQSQKMDTLGPLTAGIAHDFNNILSTIYPSAQMIMLDPLHPKVKDHAETIYEMAQRANQLTQQLLAFSRSDDEKFAVFQLNTLIFSSKQLIEKSLGLNIKMELDLSPDLKPILGDQNQFVQILLNLTINARDAMPGGGKFRIQTKNINVDDSYQKIDPAFKPGWYVNLSIEDNGLGIPEKIKNRIFEPFFTTKEKGKGTGLGLSMIYGVTKKHNGIIMLNSAVNQGTTFDFYFPASDSIVAKKSKSITVAAVKGAGTILVVDDEKDLLQTTGSILTHLGYRIYGVGSGKEAVRLYHQKQEEIDMVLLDYFMPEMDGKITFQKLKEINPHVRVIICTGYAEQEGLHEILQKGVLDVLAKPFSIETIARKIKKVLRKTSSP